VAGGVGVGDASAVALGDAGVGEGAAPPRQPTRSSASSTATIEARWFSIASIVAYPSCVA
jgi:hypothetical protein